MVGKFNLGRIVATPGALEALVQAEDSPKTYLGRHHNGDWGDLENDDLLANDRALSEGYRIFSAYRIRDGTTIWVITEADRSVTTMLLPSEY